VDKSLGFGDKTFSEDLWKTTSGIPKRATESLNKKARMMGA